MADALTELPAGIQGRDILLNQFKSLAAALRDLRAGNRNWHAVLDHPETYLESSIAFVAYVASRKAICVGLLDSSFGECTRRSWDACIRSISNTGQVLVSEATPEGIWRPISRCASVFIPGGRDQLCAIEEQ